MFRTLLFNELLLLLPLEHHWVRLHIYHKLVKRIVGILTGMTSAAKVLPRTTRRSYMMFCGAILLYSKFIWCSPVRVTILKDFEIGNFSWNLKDFGIRNLHIFSIRVAVSPSLVCYDLWLSWEAETSLSLPYISTDMAFHLIVFLLFYIKT